MMTLVLFNSVLRLGPMELCQHFLFLFSEWNIHSGNGSESGKLVAVTCRFSPKMANFGITAFDDDDLGFRAPQPLGYSAPISQHFLHK